MTKAGLRRLIDEKRCALPAGELIERSGRAQCRVLALEALRGAATVCCYVALPGEVVTDDLLRGLWGAGKAVCVPAYERETGLYRPAGLAAGEALEARRFGVREPARIAWTGWDSVDAVVVPGLAFDERGHRLGHGGGHYDRLLARVAEARVGAGVAKIGLAFEFQVLDRVPVDEHDVRMDHVATEARHIACGNEME